MGWHGPRGDCGCCGCECFADPGFFSRSFIGTPTVKVVVSGLPATIDHSYVQVRANSFEFVNRIFRTVISGLDQLNGTYFFEMTKKGSCVRNASGEEVYTTTFQRVESSVAPGASPCNPSVLIDETTTPSAVVAGNWQSASITAPSNVYVSISALQIALCRNDFIPIVSGSTNNGDIILSKLSNDATPCDTRFRSGVIDSTETEVIGSITYEMLDL